MSGDLIAVDWGTTNRRAYLIRDGIVADRLEDDRGVSAVTPDRYPAEVAALRRRLGDGPMLLAGMIGSTIGWHEAPYVAAPCGFDALAAGVRIVDARTAIVPGVALGGERPDVMRGEEVQALGAVEAGTIPRDALIVQPGTHCKWITLAGGRIERFVTAMTGELFALLRRHSILAPILAGAVEPDDAFRDGLAAGTRRDLAASLFGIRAAALLGTRRTADAASYASGLLIGAEVAARFRADRPAGPVHMLSDDRLGPLYGTAIEASGGSVVHVDSHAAFVAGMYRLKELMG